MTINKKSLISSLTAIIIFSLFIFSASFNPAVASDEYDVITGTMDEYSTSMITVDGTRHNFCKDVMVYNMYNKLIPFKSIDAALKVNLFRVGTCVQKIEVLSFGH